MRRTLFAFTLFVLAAVVTSPLLAEDNPFVGTWKLNTEKSKFKPGPGPKSQIRTVVAEGNGAKYTFEGTTADGSTVSYSFSTNYDGKESTVTGSGMPGGADSIALRRINSHKVEATLKKGGKETGKAEAEVSKDGKVTTVKSKGKTPDGKDYDSESIYDKQ